MSLAPLRPKRCQRRAVSAEGWPSSSPSQPSMGRNAPAVADGAEVGVEGLGEGRSGRGQQRIVERQVGADALEVGAEPVGSAQARDAGDALGRGYHRHRGHGGPWVGGGWLSPGEYSVWGGERKADTVRGD